MAGEVVAEPSAIAIHCGCDSIRKGAEGPSTGMTAQKRLGLFGTEMHIDPALLSALSALVGALIGGTASLVAAIYTQRYQDRLQRVAREATKREQVYADFIMSASKLLLNAYVHDGITLTGDEQHLVGLLNRMRLFAPPNVINEAEAVIRGLIEISLKPSVDFQKIALAQLSKNQQPDLVLPFSLACRADLDTRLSGPSAAHALRATMSLPHRQAAMNSRRLIR